MHFTRLQLLAAGLLSGPGLASAGRHSRRGVECYFETPAASGDTCESLAFSWGITVDLFTTINPGVNCPDLEAGKPYCVIGEVISDTTSTSTPSQPEITPTGSATTTSTTFSTSTTTTPGNGISTPLPTQPGMVGNCDKFYFVKNGESCDSVLSNNNLGMDQLVAWNPSVLGDCTGLWGEVNVCVNVIGHTPTPTGAPTHTDLPSPIQTPVASNWYVPIRVVLLANSLPMPR
jgi:hypothetical protein